MTARLRSLSERDQERAEAISAFLRTYNHSPQTQRTYESALKAVTCQLDPEGDMWTIQWEALADARMYDYVQAAVRDAVAPATTRKYMSAVDGLVRYLARVGLAAGDVFEATRKGVRHYPLRHVRDTEAITTEDLLAMLRSCRRDPKPARGMRDAALLALLASTGARRAELAGIELAHLDRGRNLVTIHDVKGGGTRTAVVHHETVGYLDDWLDVRGPGSGGLFCRVLKSGRVLPEASLGGQAVREIVLRRREEASIEVAITPHSFRRWYVSSLLENGIDVFTAARLVGHRSAVTTQRYDKRGDETLRAAVQQLPVPTRAAADEDVAANPVD